LSAVNCYLDFLGCPQLRVKAYKCQRMTFLAEEKELSREEYLRLLDASKDKAQLNLLMQTICATGIRVSEHRYITVEAVRDSPGEHFRDRVGKAPGQEPDLGRNEKALPDRKGSGREGISA